MQPHESNETAAGTLLAAALAYAARGWPVFPVNGKVPATAHGFKDASTDPEQVRAWWQEHPSAGIGIATGELSGILAVDVDAQKGGARTWKELVAAHGKVPKTAASLTGGGGSHILFRHPGDVQSSAGRLGEHVDVRADGGYIVLPPSTHPNGRPYKWLHTPEKAGIAELPAWLVSLARGRRTGPAPAISDVIPEGERDSTLTSLAGTMRRRGMSEAAILEALRVENERCEPAPLPASDLERIARSVAGYAPEEVPRNEHLEPFALDVLTAKAVCELPGPAESDQLLGAIVIRGQRVILGGHTGEGKTTAALHIVRAIVCEEDFLEWTGAGGRALFLDAEQGLRTVQRRLRETRLDTSELVDYIRVPEGLSLDSDPRHVAEVARVLEAGDYGLVVIDPLYKLHTGDSNAEREAVDLMKRLDGWREALGFALLLPVHCRKPVPGTKFSIHDLFGSSAYVRGAEVVLGLQRVSDGYARLHFLKDRDGDLPIHTAWGLLFDREEGFRRDPNEGRKPTALDKVRELLADDPELSTAQLVEITGYAERTVRKAVSDLGDEEPEE